MRVLLIFLGVVGTSLSSIFVRWSTAPSPVLVLYRMILSVLVLSPMVWTKHRQSLRSVSRRTLLLCGCSGMFLGLHFITFFTSLRYTSIAAVSVLVHTEVLFVALETILFLRTKLSGKVWIAMLLAFAGSVIVAAGDFSAGSNALLGDALALCSAVCLGSYTAIGSVCRRELDTTAYTYLVYGGTMITVLILIACMRMPVTGYGTVNLWMALCMTIFCTLLGHSVFSWGLKYFSPTYISTVRLLDALFSALWGLLLFHEIPSATLLIGGVFIIAGVVLYSRITVKN